MIRKVILTPRETSTVTDKTVASIDLVTETDKVCAGALFRQATCRLCLQLSVRCGAFPPPQACENMIFTKLRALYPDHEFLGEESASERHVSLHKCEFTPLTPPPSPLQPPLPPSPPLPPPQWRLYADRRANLGD